MIRFLHTSDLHFGACRRLTPNSNEYRDRHKKVMRLILKEAMASRVDFILAAGDLFEDAGTRVEEFLDVYEIFREWAEYCPVVITAGNHDELSVGEFQTEWLRCTEIPNVHVVSKPEVVYLSTKAGDVGILAMPWTGLKEQEDLDAICLKTLQGRKPGPTPTICMLHECFNGIVTDSGYKSIKGPVVPELPNIRYYACGDIHKMQRINLPDAWYCGAPLQFRFDDSPDKGVMIVTADSIEGTYKPEFKPIPQPIKLVEINSVKEIPADSPHWYKLTCEVSKMPRVVPTSVKMTKPIPAKIQITDQLSTQSEEKVQEFHRSIDFTERVDELLREAGFEEEWITKSVEEIRQVSQT